MFLLSLGVKFGIQKRFERNEKPQVQCKVERAASEQDCKLICLILCAGPESAGVCENCKCCEKFEKKAYLLMGLEVSLQLCRFAVFTVLQKKKKSSSGYDGEQAWTSTVNLMDSVQVGKAVFVKANYTTLGIEPKTFSYPGSFGNRTSVCWVEKESSTQCGQKEICDESWCCKALLLSMNFELIEF